MIGVYDRTVILTYAGVAAAVVGITLAASGDARGGLICLVVAGICDLFDGPLARRVRRADAARRAGADLDAHLDVARRFGLEIDSLADMVSFVALPIVVAHSLGARSVWFVPVFVGYALAGVIRLAHFNMLAKQPGPPEPVPDGPARGGQSRGGPVRGTPHYRGLPVTYAALIFPLAALVSVLVPARLFIVSYAVLMCAVAVGFVVDVPVPKPRGISYLLFAALAVATVTALLRIGV